MPIDTDRPLEIASPEDRQQQSGWREEALQELCKSLRPGQQRLAEWKGGELAISAVPGAGKSHSMAVAAAIAISRYQLHPKRQLIVVTFTRSAAASIKSKIRDRLQQLRLPLGGFVVHTLHGLALNIASRHPDSSGLDLDTGTLVTPNQSHRLLKAAVEQWIVLDPQRYRGLLEGTSFDGEETERLRRMSVLRTEVLPNLASTVIHEAKSSGLRPEDLRQASQRSRDEYRILDVAAGLYEQYERLMRSRNFIDYDDMILAALRVLENNNIRQLWQHQVFAIFEDEAQDSTPLQEELLRILAASPSEEVGRWGNGEMGRQRSVNLVRVGDPNQAINSTFTPADPFYFNRFCDRCNKLGNLATMNQAGRSTQAILNAANFTLHWVNHHQRLTAGESGEAGELGKRGKSLASEAPQASNTLNSIHPSSFILPFRPQDISPVPPDDPQVGANPEPTGQGLEIYTPDDIHHTVDLIRKRVIQLLRQNPHHSAAILVRENRQGRFLAEHLSSLKKEHQINVHEVGEAERYSKIPAEILKLLRFLDRPHSPDYLKAALEVLADPQRQLIAAQDLNLLATAPERFLYPSPLDPPQKHQVEQASRYCRNLLHARLELPHYQLISFLGMTLKYTGSELATVQKLAERVAKQVADIRGERTSPFPTIVEVLQEIVSSERFEGVEEDSDDRYTRPGQLTIITMHKAKGLDWDYVFLPFLHADVIPGQPWVPNAAKFLGDFTLAEVARAQIRKTLRESDPSLPQPLDAWEEAGKLKQAEEYRLLYVAMTRAKRLLWMSAAEQGPFRWSTLSWQQAGKLQSKKPCPVVSALKRQFPHHCIR